MKALFQIKNSKYLLLIKKKSFFFNLIICCKCKAKISVCKCGTDFPDQLFFGFSKKKFETFQFHDTEKEPNMLIFNNFGRDLILVVWLVELQLLRWTVDRKASHNQKFPKN